MLERFLPFLHSAVPPLRPLSASLSDDDDPYRAHLESDPLIDAQRDRLLRRRAEYGTSGF